MIRANGYIRNVEVKFRSTWEKKERSKLFNDIRMKQQVASWIEVDLLIVVGRPPEAETAKNVLDHVRLMPLRLNDSTRKITYCRSLEDTPLESPAVEAEWSSLIKLNDTSFGQSIALRDEDHSTAVNVLRSIAK